MHLRTPEEVQLTLKAYKHRLLTHLGAPGIRYVAVFQNRGPAAGASLEHPHSQVVALSYVPGHVAALVRRWRRHHAKNGACLLCEQLTRERQAGTRIVREQDGFVLYAPYGSVRPGELMLAPLRHRTRFDDEDAQAVAPLSDLLIYGLRQMNAAFEDLSYNLVLQTWPRGRRDDAALHWYLRMIPRRTELGGFELSTGDFVSSLAPDDAAEMYRGAAS
jgi:UDPglucose--hexose-1-phosphate uridylyltransferase